MKLDDGKPWFRKWLVIGRKPINREGRLFVNILTVLGLTPFALAMIFGLTPLTEAFLVFAALLAIAGTVFIWWKTDDGSGLYLFPAYAMHSTSSSAPSARPSAPNALRAGNFLSGK